MRSLLAIACFFLASCGYAPHEDAPLHLVGNSSQAMADAQNEAARVGGYYTQSLCCGSMAPAIQTSDFLVIKKTAWGDGLIGKAVVYTPHWNGGSPVLHRLVSGNAKDGFVASGDNNPLSEANELVTESKYKGEVVAIYRVNK